MNDSNSDEELDKQREHIEKTLASIRELYTSQYVNDLGAIVEEILIPLYRVRTHFIYELLQNTEDAYRRKGRPNGETDFPIGFDLYPDRLEVRHRGDPFNEADVRSVCGVLASTKKDKPGQIGKFGIGFKSVFAFTATPTIHSAQWHFHIENYFHPYSVEAPSNFHPDETLIIIPFNRNDVNPQIIFLELKKRLLNLGNQCLLFLPYTNRIDWCIHSENAIRGVYRKREEAFGHGQRVKLDFLVESEKQLATVVQLGTKRGVKVNFNDQAYLEPAYTYDPDGKDTNDYFRDSEGREILRNRLWKYKSRGDKTPIMFEAYRKGSQLVMKESPIEGYFWHFPPGGSELALYKDVGLVDEDLISSGSEEWLVYNRLVEDNEVEVGNVSIAFSIDKVNEREIKIVPTRNSMLVVHFPTEQAIGLKFLVHGPFNTPPSREGIRESDPWNQKLVEEFEQHIEDTMKWVKEDGLFTLDFLQIMPTDANGYVSGEIRKAASDRLKKVLLNNEFLPKAGGGFAGVDNGMMAGSSELRALLTIEQLSSLSGRKNVCWLDGNISRDDYSSLRDYLKELGVGSYTNSDFIKDYNADFAKEQTDKWTVDFYHFLTLVPSLYSNRYSSVSFRYKPIIRLEDGSHCRPFDESDNPMVFLPNPGAPTATSFRTVKASVAADPDSKRFFTGLGLRCPNKLDVIKDVIKKYKSTSIDISYKENCAEVRYLLDTLEKDLSSSEASELISYLSSARFLLAKSARDGKVCYRRASDIFIGKEFTQDDTLERLYSGCESVYFLHEGYARDYNASDDSRTLIRLGCHSLHNIVKRQPPYNGTMTVLNDFGKHIRALDGFDPCCNIPFVDEMLRTITLEKATTLWGFLLKQNKITQMLFGKIEKCGNKNFKGAIPKDVNSILAKALLKNRWIPDREGVFHIPMGLTVEHIHKSIDVNSDSAKELIIALHIADTRIASLKPIFNEETIRSLSPSLQKIASKIEEIRELDNALAEKLYQYIVRQIELLTQEKNLTSPDEMFGEIERILGTPREGPTVCPGTSPKPYNPELTDKAIDSYLAGIKETKENSKIISRIITTRRTMIVDGEGSVSNPYEYLYTEYGGRCQICGITLDLGVPGARPHFVVFRIVPGKGRSPGADLSCNIMSLCPNCRAQMKHGSSDLSNLLGVIDKAANDEAPIETVPLMSHGDFVVVPIILAGKCKKLHYSPEHIRKAAVEYKSVEPRE